MRVIQHPSPNFGPRRGTARPDLIVLHYTAMESAEAALGRLCDPASEVSAHYLVSEEGTVWQMVADDMRAWHAGAGAWGASRDVNSRSIGIELANRGDHPFPEPQMTALEALLAALAARLDIAPKGVIAHSDMAPGRKSDPGPRFDWHRLARAGLSVWPAAGEDGAEPDAGAFAASAQRFGYAADIDAVVLLRAFRLRFRPWGRGPLSPADMAALADLAQRFPVDAAPPSA